MAIKGKHPEKKGYGTKKVRKTGAKKIRRRTDYSRIAQINPFVKRGDDD